MANLSNINNKFIVEDSGDVGIGVTSATTKLHIGGIAPGAPVYNKIIDTGPSLYPNNNNTTDFTVSFIDDPQASVAGTSILCKITVTGTNSSGTALTQNIGYTVQVGHDSTNALTFTPAS